MKIFFDTEFTGLHKDTTLISIGLVSEDGKIFYGESYDFDREQVDTWIQENVIDHTSYIKEISESSVMSVALDFMYLVSTKEGLRNYLAEWFAQFDEEIELVSDVCHYDMVLLIDLFGSAFDIPKNICPVCHDINQDIADFHGINASEAFELSREAILETHGIEIEGNKHNALYDAKVIQAVYNILRGN